MGKLLLPRVTTSQRLGITPDLSELIFDTDLTTLFIGDGLTVGGISAGGSNTPLFLDQSIPQTIIEGAPVFEEGANIPKLVNLTTNGLVTVGSSDGTLGVDTNSYYYSGNFASGTDYAPATGSTTALLKGNGAGGFSGATTAVDNPDYLSPINWGRVQFKGYGGSTGLGYIDFNFTNGDRTYISFNAGNIYSGGDCSGKIKIWGAGFSGDGGDIDLTTGTPDTNRAPGNINLVAVSNGKINLNSPNIVWVTNSTAGLLKSDTSGNISIGGVDNSTNWDSAYGAMHTQGTDSSVVSTLSGILLATLGALSQAGGGDLPFLDNSSGANWVTSAPTNVQDAINRIAAVVSVGGTVPIP